MPIKYRGSCTGVFIVIALLAAFHFHLNYIVVTLSSNNEHGLSVYTDKRDYMPGDYIKIYGYFKADSYVGIEVRGPSKTLLYIGYAFTDEKGYYERSFRIPDNAIPGEYTVYVASPGYFNRTSINISLTTTSTANPLATGTRAQEANATKTTETVLEGRETTRSSATSITTTTQVTSASSLISTSFKIMTKTAERDVTTTRIVVIVVALLIAAIIYYILAKYKLI